MIESSHAYSSPDFLLYDALARVHTITDEKVSFASIKRRMEIEKILEDAYNEKAMSRETAFILYSFDNY